jgi:hypothetical protein
MSLDYASPVVSHEEMYATLVKGIQNLEEHRHGLVLQLDDGR